MFNGLLDLSPWQCLLAILLPTHLSMVASTIFLHRYQAHRALSLHPIAAHFFRFWLWLATGMRTKEWVAVHRKHHARCETVEDPHSPQVLGINQVLWKGGGLYRREAGNPVTVSEYGNGTPDDWLERHIYEPMSYLGIFVLLLSEIVLFGVVGILIWIVQMLWVPFWAAGVLNGIGHYWGYRNYECVGAARNIVPWGILLAGEELHNNHHAFPSSAKLSRKWWECDIGWIYIRALEVIGLAQTNGRALNEP